MNTTTLWTYCLYVVGVALPVGLLIGLVQHPSWGNALWFVFGGLLLGSACIRAARERQRRVRPGQR